MRSKFRRLRGPIAAKRLPQRPSRRRWPRGRDFAQNHDTDQAVATCGTIGRQGPRLQAVPFQLATGRHFRQTELTTDRRNRQQLIDYVVLLP